MGQREHQNEIVKIYIYKPGFNHMKSILADNELSFVGTINFDFRSLVHHFECGAFIHQNPVIKEIKTDFEETLKDCTLMTAQNYKAIPWYYRFIGRVFRIIAPLI